MIMEGYLTKRKDHMNIIWLERYFTLDGSNLLRYYRKRGDLSARGSYVITSGCRVGPVFNSEIKHRHHSAVWMFRITFVVNDSTEKKPRFVDLGAQTEAKALEWKSALEKTIESTRELALHRQSLQYTKADLGATPAAIHHILTKKDEEDDSSSLFELKSDTIETGWHLARVAQGLRVLQESTTSSGDAHRKYIVRQ